MNNLKLNVVFLASGYPTADNPSHGIFNQRAANAVKEHVNLTVIQYRIYKPGRKIYQLIKEDGFNRIILCVPYSPVLEQKMYYFNNKMFYYFSLLYAKHIFSSADIVHASDGNLSVFAGWLKKKFHFKLLAQFIGGDLNQDISKYYQKNWMANWQQKLDAVSFNSKALQERFKDLFIAHPLSKVIYRGVDTKLFVARPLDMNTAVFYFLGGLPDYSTFTHGRNTKGGLNLMNAWKKLDETITGEHIQLKFAGPDADIALVKEWQQQLKEPSRVQIMGKIDPENIVAFHKSGNIALVPSLEEGLPNVAMEAAATGNLVIANAVGGVPEIIVDNVNGLLCESNDEESLYQKMKWSIENPVQVASIGKRAAEMIGSDFSSEDFGKKYFQYYKDVLRGHII